METTTPKPKKKKKKGGKMPGAGRPRGAKNVATIEREEYLRRFQDKVAQRSQSLLHAQTILATGSIKVFVMRSHWEGSGKNRRKVKGRPEIVGTDKEIIDALDYEFGEGDSPNTDDEYYFVSTKDPDNSAINSLLDRTFGKAKESLEVKHKGFTLKGLFGAAEQIKKKEEDK